MRIAVDLRRIQNPGIGRYMKNLFSALSALHEQQQYLFIIPASYEGVLGNGNVRLLRERVKYYSLREQWVLPRILKREKIDLFHSPHFLLPWFCPCPSVVTIHDVIHMIFKQDLPSFTGRQYARFQLRFSARHADAIITDSESSKNEISKYAGVPANQIKVIYPAVDPVFKLLDRKVSQAQVAERFGVQGQFLLYVGLQLERKNLRRLLEAFAALKRHCNSVQLVLAGPFSPLTSVLKARATELGIENDVRFLGRVSDEDLVALYNCALAFVFPSLYEGFGFPVLEAMACGAPVITSNTSSLAELAGGAAIPVDPTSIQEISEAMERVVSDPDLRLTLAEKGLAQYRKFSWERAARETLDVYYRALKQ